MFIPQPLISLQKYGVIGFLYLFFICKSMAQVEPLPDPKKLLQRADDYRQVYEQVQLQIKLETYKNDIKQQDADLMVWSYGSDYALVKCLQGNCSGQSILMTNNGLWIKLPRTSRTLRITPIQRLMGQASYGDLVRTSWQASYQASYSETEEPKTKGAIPSWSLVLKSKASSAVYPKVHLWVAKDDGRPLHADFFLASGKLFKRASFGTPEPVEGKMMILKTTFEDALNTTKKTILNIENIIEVELDRRRFSLERLGEV
jgi:hypothetical protein